MSARGTKRITPTFQMVLNTEIRNTMDAIDEGDVAQAYVCLKTLIDCLKPEDREKIKEEMVDPIDEKLETVGRGRNVDYYTGLIKASKHQNNILYRNIRPLFRVVMGALHRGKYLEASTEPRYKSDRKLEA